MIAANTRITAAAAAAMLAVSIAGCGNAATETANTNETVSLRDLATNIAAPERAGYRLEGTIVPTPSDSESRFFLLRQRQTPTGTVIAILRQERGGKIAYSRSEVDCGKRLFHVLGVGDTRGHAEANITHDGPLRPIAGLPLREELAGFVCQRNGTPLAAA